MAVNVPGVAFIRSSVSFIKALSLDIAKVKSAMRSITARSLEIAFNSSSDQACAGRPARIVFTEMLTSMTRNMHASSVGSP